MLPIYQGVLSGTSATPNLNPALRKLNSDLTTDPDHYNLVDENSSDPNGIRTKLFLSNNVNTIKTITVSDPGYGTYPLGAPLGDPDFDNSGDGTVLSNLPELVTEFPFITAYPTAKGAHSGLIKEFESDIVTFLNVGRGFATTAKAFEVLAQDVAAATSTSLLSLFIVGRVQPYLVDPNAQASGVHYATGVFEESIPGSKVTLIPGHTVIWVDNPVAGSHSVYLQGPYEESALISLSYEDTSSDQRVDQRLLHHGGVVSFSFNFDPAGTDKITIQPPVGGVTDVTVTDASGLAQLCWQASTDPAMTGYRIYGKQESESKYTLLNTVAAAATCYDTGHAIYVDDATPSWNYVVVATNAAGNESFFDTVADNHIRVIANFSANPISGTAPLDVSFTDTSLGNPTSWAWDFDNDGTVDSTVQNPTYTYISVGTYTVTLTVSGPRGTDSQTSSNLIQVNLLPKPELVSPTNDQLGLSTTVTFEWKPVTHLNGNPVTYDFYYCTDPDPVNNCGTPVQVSSITTQPGKIYLAGIGYGTGIALFGVFLVGGGGVKRRKGMVCQIAVVVLTGVLLGSCGGGGGSDGAAGTAPNKTYTVSGLNPGTQYYWAVVAKDNIDARTSSDVWSFTTQ